MGPPTPVQAQGGQLALHRLTLDARQPLLPACPTLNTAAAAAAAAGRCAALTAFPAGARPLRQLRGEAFRLAVPLHEQCAGGARHKWGRAGYSGGLVGCGGPQCYVCNRVAVKWAVSGCCVRWECEAGGHTRLAVPGMLRAQHDPVAAWWAAAMHRCLCAVRAHCGCVRGWHAI